MGLHSVCERGWLDRSETATCRRCGWLLFSTPVVQEEAGSEVSFMQPDHEAAREAGASPDPSWHSDSDESDATNTTASTPRECAQYGYRYTRVGEAQHPSSTTSSTHSIEPASETTTYAGCKDGTTLRPEVSKVARDGWRWSAADCVWRRYIDYARWRRESRSVPIRLLWKKSSIPAPSIEIARVAHLAHAHPPDSQCTSTDLTATAEDTIPPTSITRSQTSCQPQPAYVHADPCGPVNATLCLDVHASITDTPLRTPPCAQPNPAYSSAHTAQPSTDSDPAAAVLPSDATRFADGMAQC